MTITDDELPLSEDELNAAFVQLENTVAERAANAAAREYEAQRVAREHLTRTTRMQDRRHNAMMSVHRDFGCPVPKVMYFAESDTHKCATCKSTIVLSRSGDYSETHPVSLVTHTCRIPI